MQKISLLLLLLFASCQQKHDSPQTADRLGLSSNLHPDKVIENEEKALLGIPIDPMSEQQWLATHSWKDIDQLFIDRYKENQSTGLRKRPGRPDTDYAFQNYIARNILFNKKLLDTQNPEEYTKLSFYAKLFFTTGGGRADDNLELLNTLKSLEIWDEESLKEVNWFIYRQCKASANKDERTVEKEIEMGLKKYKDLPKDALEVLHAHMKESLKFHMEYIKVEQAIFKEVKNLPLKEVKMQIDFLKNVDVKI